jgi:hypothetical protein
MIDYIGLFLSPMRIFGSGETVFHFRGSIFPEIDGIG